MHYSTYVSISFSAIVIVYEHEDGLICVDICELWVEPFRETADLFPFWLVIEALPYLELLII